MFNWLKNFFNPTKDPEWWGLVDNGIKKIVEEEIVPSINPKFTKKQLLEYTKTQLELLGRTDFGIELDKRKKKDTLIDEILKAQENRICS